jgi:hypothetical protein
MSSARSVQDHVKQLLLKAGWKVEDILENQTFSHQGSLRRVDVVLSHNLYPLAVVEVKAVGSSLESAIDQVLQYAEAVAVSFGFITDGVDIIEVDAFGGEAKARTKFPTPQELWSSLGREWHESDPRLFPPHQDPSMMPRIYQVEAVSRVVEAVLSDKKRILVSMAQGTGKTYVAFQVAWKLVKSGTCRRMLYLGYSRAQIDFASRLFSPFAEDLQRLTDLGDAQLSYKAMSRRVHLGTASFFTRSRASPSLGELPPNLYDLILVEDAAAVKSAEPILERFPEAFVVGFVNVENPGSKVIQSYGQPVFAYSLTDALEAGEVVRVPEGFRVVQLDDIAEIGSGVVIGKDAADKSGDGSYPVVAARDILADGTIDAKNLREVSSDALSFSTKTIDFDSRFLLQVGDILIATLSPGQRIKVALITEKLSESTLFSNSLIRVRVDPTLADSRDVCAYLRSDNGQFTMRRFATTLGGTAPRILIRDLRQIPILLPKADVPPDAIKSELSAVSRAMHELQEEILPKLNEMERRIGEAIDVADQECELVAGKLQRIAL